MTPSQTESGYNSARAYELISQFRLISSNCGGVHSIDLVLSVSQLQVPGFGPKISKSVCVPTKT